MIRIAYVVTIPTTAHLLLRGQLKWLRSQGFHVTLVCAPGPEIRAIEERENIPVLTVPMERAPSPHKDAVALPRMVAAMRRIKPHIVNVSTPKGALLGSIAAAVCRVPARVYLVRGLRLETADGALRRILTATERTTCACVHRVYCNSPSLLERFVELELCSKRKLSVIGPGTSNGIDVKRFDRSAHSDRGAEHRQMFNIGPKDKVIGFVGRPVVDKGVMELLDAFERIARKHEDVHLIMVGAQLAGDGIARDIAERVRALPRAHAVDAVSDPETWYAAMDVLAFPSKREGFPNVPLEAAASDVPVVGFRVTGVVDAVLDGETGTLVPNGDIAAFERALLAYIDDESFRRKHGRAARNRVEKTFACEVVWRAWADEYEALLRNRQ